MVYECECGSVLKHCSPCNIPKHLNSDKRIIWTNGGDPSILRRVMILRSNISYCQNHPSWSHPKEDIAELQALEAQYLVGKEAKA